MRYDNFSGLSEMERFPSNDDEDDEILFILSFYLCVISEPWYSTIDRIHIFPKFLRTVMTKRTLYLLNIFMCR